jgi:hypothetical protein
MKGPEPIRRTLLSAADLSRAVAMTTPSPSTASDRSPLHSPSRGDRGRTACWGGRAGPEIRYDPFVHLVIEDCLPAGVLPGAGGQSYPSDETRWWPSTSTPARPVQPQPAQRHPGPAGLWSEPFAR